jgi:phosphatidylserine/phosphatidylglycerophosphate/cardiolipin synthase-like enzyme
MNLDQRAENVRRAVDSIANRVPRGLQKALVSFLIGSSIQSIDRQQLNELGLDNAQAMVILRTISNIPDEYDSLVMALDQRVRHEKERMYDLTWTGRTDIRSLRLTGPVTFELMREAENEVVVVGYSISTGSSNLVEELANASRRGVELTFMVNRLETQQEFMRWVEGLTIRPRLYSMPPDPLDDKAAMHVKCIVVDRKKALVGSANPTYHGMEKNIEMGFLVKDKEMVDLILECLEELKTNMDEI